MTPHDAQRARRKSPQPAVSKLTCSALASAAVREAINQGFIRYVMDIIPNTWPDFLPDQAAFLKNRSES